MKKVILVANQCDYVPLYNDCDYIGIDKGSLYCINHHIKMKYAIGDFDSINEDELQLLKENTEIISLPKRKNESDGEYAIRFANLKGYDQIDVYGVIGGRQDHFLTILYLLRYHDIPFRMFDKQNCIYRLDKGEYKIPKNSKYISIFACEELNLTLEGVEYPLNNVHISPKDLYLVSNEIIDTATIKCDGRILIVESNDVKMSC